MTEDTSALIKDARTRAHNVLTNGAIGDLLLKLANALQASLAADVVVARFTDEAMQIARSQAIEETREADIAAVLEIVRQWGAGELERGRRDRGPDDYPGGQLVDAIRALSPPPAVTTE